MKNLPAELEKLRSKVYIVGLRKIRPFSRPGRTLSLFNQEPAGAGRFFDKEADVMKRKPLSKVPIYAREAYNKALSSAVADPG